MKVLANNKRARFDYKILQTYEAGIVLTGQEVKSVKQGNVSLKSAYVTFKKEEDKNLPAPYLLNCHISPYKQAGNLSSYDPERHRKLLLKKSELKTLIGKTQEKSLTLVPLKIYTTVNRIVKAEIGLAQGKKKVDKREDIKKRDMERKIRTFTKRKNYL